MIVIVILGQSSRGHSQMRAHEARRGNAHLRRSANSIKLSRRWRSWWCIRGDARGQLFEGRKLRWKARWVAWNRARGRVFPWPRQRRAGTASSGGRGVDRCAGQREWHHACAASHLLLAQLPVHGLCGTPRDGHFLRDFGPHFCFESMESSVSTVQRPATRFFLFPTVRITGPVYSSCPHPTRCGAPGSSGSGDDS